jgi:predicted phosphodiesterase
MTLRLAVLSDLHAAPRSEEKSSHEVKLFTDGLGTSPLEHPLLSLEAFIEQTGLSADVVVCPGDMTNRANPQALSYVWSGLHSLKERLKARAIIATVGNHDVDSRGHGDDSFPRESLMRLRPRFPVDDAALADHYWAHGYYISEISGVRFLVLNSCWLHESRDALDRGVVTSYTLDRLKQELAQSHVDINVAICHHHPHAHGELGLGQDDVMRNGQQLIDLLSDFGSWLIIHGHKHHPKIEYAAGQDERPVIMACGSFSGRLEGENATVSRNYFHLIDISLSELPIHGRVSSWTWASGMGWIKYADANSKFPSEFGFGFQGAVAPLAARISSRIAGAPMKWSDLVAIEPEVSYLMPRTLKKLIDQLKNAHNLNVVFDEYSSPIQIGAQL